MDAAQLRVKFEPKDLEILQTKDEYSTLRYTPCGKFLVAGGYDGRLHRWDAEADVLTELNPVAGFNGWVAEVAFAPTGELVYAVDTWGRLACVPYAGDAPQPRWQHEAAHDGWVQGVAASPDGRFVATCGNDRRVRLWNAADGAHVRDFAGHDCEVFVVAFSPDSQALVSGDLRGHVRQWDLATGQQTREFDAKVLYTENRLQEVGGVRRLTFSADGKQLAVAGTTPANGGNVQGGPTILVFDWTSGMLAKSLTVGASGDVFVTDVHFHPEGFLMATCCGNPGQGKLVCRRIEDDQNFFETNRIPNCHSLSPHPDGRRFAILSTNAGSNGNGRSVGPNGEYLRNFSPIFIVGFPPAA